MTPCEVCGVKATTFGWGIDTIVFRLCDTCYAKRIWGKWAS